MPNGIDILITHSPPVGILDVEYGTQVHAGDPEFLKAAIRVRPRLHVFGHIHGGYGTATRDSQSSSTPRSMPNSETWKSLRFCSNSIPARGEEHEHPLPVPLERDHHPASEGAPS